MVNKKYISTTEAAKLLGISRVAVFKKIKSGEIKAEKIGRNFAIPAKEMARIFEKKLSKKDREAIIESVNRVVSEYGETLKLLGRD